MHSAPQPDPISTEALERALAGGTVGSRVLFFDIIDSTNTELKRRCAAGAPDGLTVIANCQTGGRGRQGRSFLSPAGKGLYLSVLLRPRCETALLSTLTAWAAVAVCDAVEHCCGVRPRIKWPNDLVLDGRKLCGILTEVVFCPDPHVILGIGVNVSQQPADFSPEVAAIATSLEQALGQAPQRQVLAEELLRALDALHTAFPSQAADYLARYRTACLTLGQPVKVVYPHRVRCGTAVDVDDRFALTVRWEDGSVDAVSSGEVSVRGLYGYTE